MPLENQTFCVGADDIIDLADYPDAEHLISEKYDTVCVARFCGKHPKCDLCENLYRPTIDDPIKRYDAKKRIEREAGR